MLKSALQDLAMFIRYASKLPGYLRTPLTPAEAEARIRRSLESRNANFLRIVRRGVYNNPRSPYLRLLRHASVEYGDIERLVLQDGVEGALGKLYDAGVYVSNDEFKGRQPIRRAGLEFEVQTRDFGNPLTARDYMTQSSGSRGTARRVAIDLDLLVQETAHIHQFLSGYGLEEHPVASWRPVPPVSSGMKLMLRHARTGRPAVQWFSQSRHDPAPQNIPFFIFTVYTIFASRLVGRPIPNPRYVPRDQAWRIARWLAEQVRAGQPAMLDTNGSAAVRVCREAQRLGLDLAGTFFRTGGEPLTPGKARAIAAVGARVGCYYSMAEVGQIGVGCAGPHPPGDDYLDDVHVVSDKIAVVQRPTPAGPGGAMVDALIYTTVHPACPLLMLNVESGDFAILEERECGCPMGRLGMKLHLRQIRSYEKLTSEGVTFLGTELIRLVEDVLPARFGGSAVDYQLVEQEEGGLQRVNIVIDPRVGAVSDAAVLDAVRTTLAEYPGGDIMADQWQQSGTLRVVRRSPYATLSSKILPLYVLPRS